MFQLEPSGHHFAFASASRTLQNHQQTRWSEISDMVKLFTKPWGIPTKTFLESENIDKSNEGSERNESCSCLNTVRNPEPELVLIKRHLMQLECNVLQLTASAGCEKLWAPQREEVIPAGCTAFVLILWTVFVVQISFAIDLFAPENVGSCVLILKWEWQKSSSKRRSFKP